MNEYCVGGSKRFYSPEKKDYFLLIDKYNENFEKLEKIGLEETRKQLQEENNALIDKMENSIFDPFKCDLYSLGKCVKELISPADANAIVYLKNMLKPTWTERAEAVSILEYLSNDFNSGQVACQEGPYLEVIEKNRRKLNLKDYYTKFDMAYMPAEMLSVANEELRVALEQQSQGKDISESLIAEIKFRRGERYFFNA